VPKPKTLSAEFVRSACLWQPAVLRQPCFPRQRVLGASTKRDYFRELGVRPFINAAGVYTTLTASLMLKYYHSAA